MHYAWLMKVGLELWFQISLKVKRSSKSMYCFLHTYSYNFKVLTEDQLMRFNICVSTERTEPSIILRRGQFNQLKSGSTGSTYISNCTYHPKFTTETNV